MGRTSGPVDTLRSLGYCSPVAGSFRHGAPAIPVAYLRREHLMARLERRWSCRLLTVVAGPGFGKTSLLGAAMNSECRRPNDRDVWLTCEPADSVGASFLEGIAQAMGLAAATFEGAVRAVWHAAPAQVCFVLDDAHELRDGSEGAEILTRLVTELPRNGHVVLSSRSMLPVPLARLAAAGQLERIGEEDLLFTADEVAEFADVRGVDRSALTAAGGWPALVQLAAAAGDLVDDYLWNEVLATLGDARAREVALLGAVGRVDDEVAAAVLGPGRGVRDVVDEVPLVSWTVEESDHAWAALHPLWDPVLRTRRSETETANARLDAARVHRARGRLDAAIDLFAQAEAWDDVLGTIREAAMFADAFEEWHRFARWRSLLPDRHQDDPVAHLAAGIEVASRVPVDSVSAFELAARGFRETGDAAGELAALGKLGVVAWWSNDIATLFGVIGRGTELAAEGLAAAQIAARVGDAALAHASGDPERVLEVLAPIDLSDAGDWAGSAGWLRAVAHRRRGDLERAEQAVHAVARLAPGDMQLVVAQARGNWLRGNVDEVPDALRRATDHYRAAQHHYLMTESMLELAARLAWLGERHAARQLLDEASPDLASTPGALATVLWTIGNASLAVDRGDEAAARELLAAEPLSRPGTPNSWYWVDRAAVALVHVLLPEDREAWAREVTAPVHRVAIDLATALEAVRGHDLSVVRRLAWPASGRARAYLPLAWLAELAVAGFEAGNAPPPDLIDHLVAEGRSPLHRTARGSRDPESAAVLEVLAFGPVRLLSDGQPVEHENLHRRRVRELLAVLAVGRMQRRDEIADLMWPEATDPRHNLRVTLGYLRRVIGDHPALVVDQGRVQLLTNPWLRCDVRELDDLLHAADAAEREGDPERALDRYDTLLPMWRGDPFADLGDLDWIRDEQTLRRGRFVTAAVRAGDLHLAAGSFRAALGAATSAIDADRFEERAHRVAIAALLAEDDLVGARAAAARCVAALSELDVTPSQETAVLIDAAAAR